MKRSCLVLSPTLFGRDFLPHGAWALPGVGVGAKWGVTAGDQRPPTRRVPSQLVPPSAGPLSCPRPSYATSEESRILVLTELLERKAHSPFYQEGVSNALLKMAELGLTRAAAVLLRNGANLNFEGPPEPGGLGWTDGLGVAWAGVGGGGWGVGGWSSLQALPSSVSGVMPEEARTGWPPSLQVSQRPLTASARSRFVTAPVRRLT